MRIKCLYWKLLLFILLSGCSSSGLKDSYNKIVGNDYQKISGNLEKIIIDDLENENLVYTDIKAGTLVSKDDLQTANMIDVKDEILPAVQKWMKYFTGRAKDRFNRYLNRGEVYKEIVESILKEHGLPADLYYLAMIESGYHVKAKSSASAVGPWQFIRSTGRQYKLRINNIVDERRNIIKSTQAAAAHLRDLHNIFGSWELALAAYNAGTNRIMGIILKGNHRDYWKLAEMGILPRETKNYIPKLIAAQILGKNPRKFGFKIEDPSKSLFKNSSEVSFKGGVSLKRISNIINVSYDHLRELNPELKTRYLPLGKKYNLRVPKVSIGMIAKKSMVLARLKTRKLRVKEYAPTKYRYYRVKRGDTLLGIANKYNTSIQEILTINRIRSVNRLRIGQSIRLSNDFSGIYRVRSGDNLSSIASRYKISLRQLKSVNGLKSNNIYKGQRLRISAKAGFYVVKNGDTLWDIAKDHNLSIRKIKKMNSLKNSRIVAGQKLVVKK